MRSLISILVIFCSQVIAENIGSYSDPAWGLNIKLENSSYYQEGNLFENYFFQTLLQKNNIRSLSISDDNHSEAEFEIQIMLLDYSPNLRTEKLRTIPACTVTDMTLKDEAVQYTPYDEIQTNMQPSARIRVKLYYLGESLYDQTYTNEKYAQYTNYSCDYCDPENLYLGTREQLADLRKSYLKMYNDPKKMNIGDILNVTGLSGSQLTRVDPSNFVRESTSIDDLRDALFSDLAAVIATEIIDRVQTKIDELEAEKEETDNIILAPIQAANPTVQNNYYAISETENYEENTGLNLNATILDYMGSVIEIKYSYSKPNIGDACTVYDSKMNSLLIGYVTYMQNSILTIEIQEKTVNSMPSSGTEIFLQFH